MSEEEFVREEKKLSWSLHKKTYNKQNPSSHRRGTGTTTIVYRQGRHSETWQLAHPATPQGLDWLWHQKVLGTGNASCFHVDPQLKLKSCHWIL